MLLMCLALNIYFEATMNNIDDRIGVTRVVINRIDSPRWPNNACEVISEQSYDVNRPKSCQFSWTCDELPDFVKFQDLPEFNKMFELASRINSGELHYDPTLGADHYIVCGTKTDWAARMTFTVKIGKHCFYKS